MELALAVEDPHLVLVVAGAGDGRRRERVLDAGARSAGESFTSRAPSDSASCARVRAPITGTMVGALGQHPGDRELRARDALLGGERAAARRPARWLRSRFSPVKRGRCARKSPGAAGLEPLSRPRDSTP